MLHNCFLVRYNTVLEACCLLPDLAELPYGDMTEVFVEIYLCLQNVYHVFFISSVFLSNISSRGAFFTFTYYLLFSLLDW